MPRSLSWGSSRQAPGMFGFEGQWGLWGKPEGCTKHRLFLEGMHKISHTLSHSRKKPVSDPFADLRDPPGKAGGSCESPWEHQC